MRTTRHFEILDGLRGIAAIAVAVMHICGQFGLTYAPHHAYLAVPFFFMLSGFVIGYAYEDRLMHDGTVIQFMGVRIKRLYPMLLIALLCAVVIHLIMHLETPAKAGLLLAYGLVMFPIAEITAFPLLQTQWSLAVELYGNFVHRLMHPLLSTRVLVIALIPALAFLAYAAWAIGGLDGGWNLVTIPHAMACFAFCYGFGILLFRLHRDGKLPALNLPPWAIVALLTTTFIMPQALHSGFNAVLDVLCAVIIYPVVIVAALGARFGTTAEQGLKALGRLSYPLYILHFPLVLLAGETVRRVAPSSRLLQYFSVPVITLACVLISWFALVAIDEPLRRTMRKRETARVPPPHEATEPRPLASARGE